MLKARSSLQVGSLHLIEVPPEGLSDRALLEDLRHVLRIADQAAEQALIDLGKADARTWLGMRHDDGPGRLGPPP